MAAGDAQARHRGLLEGAARSVAGGPVRRRPRDRPAHHAGAVVPPRRARRTTATRGRSKAWSCSSTSRPARCSRSRTTASCRFPPTRVRTSRRTTRRPRAGLRPLDIVQPDGPSFTVDGHADHVAAVVAARVDGSVRGARAAHRRLRGRRPRAARSSTVRPVSEMVVPYGDPGPLHGWKNAFDAGEWGLGRLANSLALGCDCLGEIRYLDAVLRRRARQPARRSRTPSASTRRTTGSSGSTGTCRRTRPRSADRAGSWSARSRRSATTSTASTGTSISTARCSSR